jgi:hypothetical protein
MRNDPLQQFAKLRQQLLQEKSQIEARLGEINRVLGSETTPSATPPADLPGDVAPVGRRGRGRRGGNEMSLREAVLQALAHGPVARKDLVKAVQDVGYKFTTKNPLNSIGSILYGKNTPVKSKDGMFFVGGRASALSGSGEEDGNGQVPARRKKKRTMSPEARAKISAAQSARWAKQKGGK